MSIPRTQTQIKIVISRHGKKVTFSSVTDEFREDKWGEAVRIEGQRKRQEHETAEDVLEYISSRLEK